VTSAFDSLCDKALVLCARSCLPPGTDFSVILNKPAQHIYQFIIYNCIAIGAELANTRLRKKSSPAALSFTTFLAFTPVAAHTILIAHGIVYSLIISPGYINFLEPFSLV
jgi:hypothetical protein